jgi:hypothetical protein
MSQKTSRSDCDDRESKGKPLHYGATSPITQTENARAYKQTDNDGQFGGEE